MTSLKKKRHWIKWVLLTVVVIAVFFLGMVLSTIIERRAESNIAQQDGKPNPRIYETHDATEDISFASKYGGAAERDYLEENPDLVILWAGYSFSKDYKQGRGHFYAVSDIRSTLRTDAATVGTCWTCKSTSVPRMMKTMGNSRFYSLKWLALGSKLTSTIDCLDCHDIRYSELKVTRAALIEAFEEQGKAINDFSYQEMRSLVCAQCHSEYYFKGEKDYLVFPWQNGFNVDEVADYYDSIDFSDWTHTLSRAPMLKAQHPDYELFQAGVHADRGLSCSDCHMPYRSEGALKFTDHKIQSPLNNIVNTCLVCHPETEEKLRQNVYERQDKIAQLKKLAEATLVKAHIEAKTAWDNRASEDDMEAVLNLIRQAQWRWDWVGSANGVGIHAPLESARVLATAIQKAGEARNLLAVILTRQDQKLPLQMPDISTKEKAQKYIGLDMEKLKKDKTDFLKDKAAKWDIKPKKSIPPQPVKKEQK